MVDAMIRPVFVRARTDSEPKIFTYSDSLSGTTSATHNIIPGPGETWAVNYVSIITPANSTNAHTASIQIVDAGTAITIEMDASMSAVGDKISFGSFGNGPLLIRSNFYLRIYVTCATNSVTFNTVVSVSKV
jgi:hypothetical protein